VLFTLSPDSCRLCCAPQDQLPDREYVLYPSACHLTPPVVFAEAMADAKAKDAAYAAGGAAEGLFWGLPGSFKGEHRGRSPPGD
jgi:hypothetical protein